MPGRKSIRFCGLESTRIGTSFHRNQKWMSLDIGGLIGISISISIHLYALTILAWKIVWVTDLVYPKVLYFVLYVPIAVIALLSLYKATTTDPGAVPLGARPFTTFRMASSSSSSDSTSLTCQPVTNGDTSTNINISSNNNNNYGSKSPPHHSLSSSGQQLLIPTNNNNTASAPIRRCHKCQDNYKPARAHHDSVTGRCIVKFDHFCPWINNAVGAMNHKFFCLFLWYTAASCLVSLALLLIRVIHCTQTPSASPHFFMSHSTSTSTTTTTSSLQQQQQPHYQQQQQSSSSSSVQQQGLNDSGLRQRFLSSGRDDFHSDSSSSFYTDTCIDFMSSHLVLGLLIASIVFLIFTTAMSCEQLEAIGTGKSKIARMKQSIGQSGTELYRVTEEFNEMFGGTTPSISWHWFLPIDLYFPRGMKKIILGYDWDPTFPSISYQPNDSNGTDPINRSTHNDTIENRSNDSFTDLEAGLISQGGTKNSNVRRSNSEELALKFDGLAGVGRGPVVVRRKSSQRRLTASEEEWEKGNNDTDDEFDTISIQSAPTGCDGLFRSNVIPPGIPGSASLYNERREASYSSSLPTSSNTMNVITATATNSTTTNNNTSLVQRKNLATSSSSSSSSVQKQHLQAPSSTGASSVSSRGGGGFTKNSHVDDTGIALVDRIIGGTAVTNSNYDTTNGGTSTRPTIPKIV